MMHRQVFQYYDVIGIAERIDESLTRHDVVVGVVCPTEVIVLSSKQAGGYGGGGSRHNISVPRLKKLS